MRYPTLLAVLFIAFMAASCSMPSLKASELPGSIRVDPGVASRVLGKIRIESYRPSDHGPDDPILLVMHGGGRNADDYRDAWVEVANDYNIMIIAPAFAEHAFPGPRGYNLGNMEGPFGGDHDRDLWAFSFVQPIFSGTVPAYRRGRMALLGDAGAVAPPFTGSGVFKAMMNAVELATTLAESSSVDGALEDWSARQTERGKRLAALGDQMEVAFVWEAPDLSSMTEPDARAWWAQSIAFPEEFSYVSEA